VLSYFQAIKAAFTFECAFEQIKNLKFAFNYCEF